VAPATVVVHRTVPAAVAADPAAREEQGALRSESTTLAVARVAAARARAEAASRATKVAVEATPSAATARRATATTTSTRVKPGLGGRRGWRPPAERDDLDMPATLGTPRAKASSIGSASYRTGAG